MNPGPMPTGRAGGRGQHFIKNGALVDAIVKKAGIKSTDTVLEIGPGNGAMTLKMLQKAKKVVAVEVDPRMIGELQKRVQGRCAARLPRGSTARFPCCGKRLVLVRRLSLRPAPFAARAHSERASHLHIVHGDALKTELPYFHICVANIPYNVRVPLRAARLGHRARWGLLADPAVAAPRSRPR